MTDIRPRKLITCAAVIGAFAISLCGCGKAYSGQNSIQEGIQQKAAGYIEDKYGFTVKITDVDMTNRRGNEFDGGGYRDAMIYAKDEDNKPFRIYWYIGSDDTEASDRDVFGDDYQKDLIEAAYSDEYIKVLESEYRIELSRYIINFGHKYMPTQFSSVTFDGDLSEYESRQDNEAKVWLYTTSDISDITEDDLKNVFGPDREILLYQLKDEDSYARLTELPGKSDGDALYIESRFKQSDWKWELSDEDKKTKEIVDEELINWIEID